MLMLADEVVWSAHERFQGIIAGYNIFFTTRVGELNRVGRIAEFREQVVEFVQEKPVVKALSILREPDMREALFSCGPS